MRIEVESYISSDEEELIISVIFLFDDSEYYFSIVEKDTKRGKMELIVNQYTGDNYPEVKPHMI